MRRIAFIAIAATLVACSNEPTSPAIGEDYVAAAVTLSQAKAVEISVSKKCKTGSFPPLTDAQKAQMAAYQAAYDAAVQADLQAVKTGSENLRLAIRAGASRAEVPRLGLAARPKARKSPAPPF